jgi:hypothetical protein
VHASVFDGDEDTLQSIIDGAETWYHDHRCEFHPGGSLCGCGNVNCSSDGKFTLQDIVFLFGFLFLGDPIQDTTAANVDLCNGVDLADLLLLIDEVYGHTPGEGFCDGSIDCDYQPEGDSVELVVSFWPHDHADYSTENRLQIDMWVRNASEVVATEMYCGWDNPNVIIDSVATSSAIDTIFYPGDLYSSALEIGGDNSTRTFYFQGYNRDVALPANPDNKWVWVRYFFTVTDWSMGDSIVIDLEPNFSGATLRMVTLQPSGQPIGFIPHWTGRLVIKDGFEQCCGIYAAPPDERGNVNCSYDGKITLSDITMLIDKVYISKKPLCCSPNGNTNASVDLKHTLSDITQLIDRVYISKLPTEPCL